MGLVDALTVATNTYITVVEADAYVADERAFTKPASSFWTGASSAQKNQALLMAAKNIDQAHLAGSKQGTDSDQPLSFPRTNAELNPDDLTTIPNVVKQAQAEEAIALLQTSPWNFDPTVKEENAPTNFEGAAVTRNPNSPLWSFVAHRLLFDAGWLCMYGLEKGFVS